jgi:hypothetical protein
MLSALSCKGSSSLAGEPLESRKDTRRKKTSTAVAPFLHRFGRRSDSGALNAVLSEFPQTPSCRIAGRTGRCTSKGLALSGHVPSTSLGNEKKVQGHCDENYRSSEDSKPKPYPGTHPTLPIHFLRAAISKSPTDIKTESNDKTQKSGQQPRSPQFHLSELHEMSLPTEELP